MIDRWLFEIPVYRVSEDAWLDDAAIRLDAWAAGDLARRAEHGLPKTEGDRLNAQMWARWAERVYGWRYNEVIAWVALLWDGPGPVIKAYLWRVGKPTLTAWEPRRRFRRGFHPFPFFGGISDKAFELWVSADDSDAAVYRRLRDKLAGIVAPGGDLPRRHIDLTSFDTIGPHVRWRHLLGLDK